MDPSQGGQFQGAPPTGIQGGPPGGFPGGRGPGGFGRVFMVAGPIAMLFLGVMLVLLAVAFYQLYKKAGFKGWIGLLMLIPIVNWGVLLYLAFADWPVLQKMRDLQKQVAALTVSSPQAAATADAVEPTSATAGAPADAPPPEPGAAS